MNDTDEAKTRELLWLGHGHDALYGDDGEMQCGVCKLDYKRDPLPAVVSQALQVLTKAILDTAAACCAFETNSAEASEVFEVLLAAGRIPNKKPGPRLAELVTQLLTELRAAQAHSPVSRLVIEADRHRVANDVREACAREIDKLLDRHWPDTGDRPSSPPAYLLALHDKIAALDLRPYEKDPEEDVDVHARAVES